MKCSFCKKQIEEGTGKIIVQPDSSVIYFCGSKCERNWSIRGSKTKEA